MYIESLHEHVQLLVLRNAVNHMILGNSHLKRHADRYNPFCDPYTSMPSMSIELNERMLRNSMRLYSSILDSKTHIVELLPAESDHFVLLNLNGKACLAARLQNEV